MGILHFQPGQRLGGQGAGDLPPPRQGQSVQPVDDRRQVAVVLADRVGCGRLPVVGARAGEQDRLGADRVRALDVVVVAVADVDDL